MSNKILWSINFIIGLAIMGFSLWYLHNYDPKFSDDLIAEYVIPTGMVLTGFLLPFLHSWRGTSAWYALGISFSCSFCLTIPYQWLFIQRTLAESFGVAGILFCGFTLLGILGALSGHALRKMKISLARKRHA